MSFEEKFKEFQEKLLEKVTEVDPNATINYSQDPQGAGIVVQIDSVVEGYNEFLVYGSPNGQVNFVRLWR